MDNNTQERKVGWLSRLSSFLGRASGATKIAQSGRALSHNGFLTGEIKKIRAQSSAIKSEPQQNFSHIEDEKERFYAANQARGVTEQQLMDAKNYYRLLMRMFGLLSLIAFAWGTYTFSLRPTGWFLIDFFYSYIVLGIPLVLTLKNAFHYAQLRDERLYHPRYFLKNIQALFVKGTTYSVAFLFAAFFALSPDMAAAANEMIIPEKDLFTRLLQILLNGVGPIPESDEISPWVAPLAVAFGTFNTALMGIGTMWLSWQTVALAVNSAQEGVPLGKKVHNVWAPLRVSWGFGMLAPIAGGFNAVQILVLVLAMQGSTMASYVWSSFTSYYSTDFVADMVKAEQKEEAEELKKIQEALKKGEIIEPTNPLSSGYADMSQLQSGALQTLGLQILEKQACLAGVRDMFRYAHASERYIDKPFTSLADGSEESAVIWTKLRARLGVDENPKFLGITIPANLFESEGKATAREVMGSIDPKVLIRGYVRPVIKNVPSEQAGDVIDKSIIFNNETPDATMADVIIADPPTVRKTFQRYTTIPVIELNYGEVCGKITVNTVNTELIADLKDQNQALNRAGDIRSAFFSATNESAQKIDEIILKAQAQTAIKQRDLIDNLIRTSYISLVELFSEAGGARGSAAYLADPSINVEDAINLRGQVLGNTEWRQANPGVPTADHLLYEALKDFRKDSMLIGFEQDLLIANALKDAGMNTMDVVVKEIGQRGWAAAGSFYTIIAQLSGNRHRMGAMEISSTDTDYNAIESLVSEAARENMIGNPRDGSTVMNSGTLGLANVFISKYKEANTSYANELVANEGSSDGLLEWINSKAGTVTASLIKDYEEAQFRPFTAFIDLVKWGHAILDTLMLTVVGAFMVAIAPVGLVSGTAATITEKAAKIVGGPALKLLINLFTFGAQVVFVAIFAVGILHAYILPLVPYFYATFAVIGMLILIAEAMVAAPLWMFRHINMEGDDFVRSDLARGYMICMNLLMRPALIIFALVLSYAIFSAGVFLISETIFTAFFGVVGQGYGVIGSIIFAVTLGYIHWQMALQAFSLITSLPDRVNRWVNEQGEQLGEDQETQKATNFFVAGVQNKVETVGRAGIITNSLSNRGGAPSAGSGGGLASKAKK